MAIEFVDDPEAPLIIADLDSIKSETEAEEGKLVKLSAEVESELSAEAQKYADQLFDLDQSQANEARNGRGAVEGMGLDIQRDSARKSGMLKAPISKLSKRGDDGGEVANALVDLKVQVEDLDPVQFNFEPGWFSRAMGYLPFVGSPIKKYFTRYESAQTVLGAISNSLENGRAQLRRDSETLLDDQGDMRNLTRKLEKAIALGQAIDRKLSTRLERELNPGDPKFKFLSEEILFPLRQRIQDLQQQIVVNQQGIISIEIIIRNNKELIRGVNRALNVTMSALQVAVTLALALADQKIVLDKITAINETTNDLIAGTAKRLKEQGAAIHKQAASTTLDMAVLKQAFVDIRAALDDISSFRQAALPQMAQTILDLDKVTADQEGVIRQLEEGNRVSSSLKIEVKDND